MNRFPGLLRVELLSDRTTWRLLAPFSYLDPDHGLVVAPAGFATDFASVRPVRTLAVALLIAGLLVCLLLPALGSLLLATGVVALVLYAAVVGYGQEAAALHDWLYTSRELSRAAADRVLLNAMRSSGIARWRAWVMWAGVRIGGKSRYAHAST